MESSNKSRLGKGLGALIPKTRERKYILDIEVEKIKANPLQPRKTFDEDKLEELSASIKENGIIQPIVVREAGEFYEIIAGERRYRATLKAGLRFIPAILRDEDVDKRLEMAIIENVQREDLNPVEEGEAYKLLIEKYGYTQEVLAKQLGKSRVSITNTMRLLKLPDIVKNYVVNGKISSGHARAIISLPNKEEQISLAEKIINEGLSVREVEAIVKDGKKLKEKTDKIVKSFEIIEIEKKLKKFLGTKVKIKDGKDSRGKIEIEYYSNGDLERILETFGFNK